MIGDLQNIMSDDQDLAVAAGTTLSTYSVNLGVVGTIPGVGGSPIADLMRGNQPKLLVQVTEAFDSVGDDTTLKVELLGATDTGLTSSLVVYDVSLVIAQATLVAGYKFKVNFPEKVTKQYIGLRYTTGTSTATAGKVTAGFYIDTSSAHPLGG